MKKILTLFIALAYFMQLHAQAPATISSDEIYLQLKKLQVLGSVLYIAAHPDDENTRLLAYLSKEKQYRTGYLSLTRGDGGQNLIGDEQGIELGLIRTQELLAARRIDGAEQFFSRAYDFGFSKNATEALSIWGHDKILSDVVWMIRKFQPDVIITRFPGDERAGHGHHWASALLANEAFKAAADPTKFPEQFEEGVKPWQAKRILWNTYNFGSINTTDSTQFKMDVGTYNALLGKGYGEIASESRSQHKSQGFGVAKQRGEATEYFKLTGGEGLHDSLMDGVNTTWTREKNGAAIEQQVNNIIAQYSFEHPEKIVPQLVELYKAIKQMPEDYWRNRKLDEVQNIIINCAGIFAEATTNNEYAIPGDSLDVNFTVIKRNDANLTLQTVTLNAFDSTMANKLPVNQNISFTKSLPVSFVQQFTQPYWLQKPLTKGSFDVENQALIGKPQNEAEYIAKFTFNILGENFNVYKPLQYKYTDPVKGEVYEPVSVIAPVIVSMTPGIVFTNVKPGSERTTNPVVKVQYKTNFTRANTSVTIKILQDSTTIFSKDTVVNAEMGKTFQLLVPIKQYIKASVADHLSANVIIQSGNRRTTYAYYLRKIQYEHIPNIHYFYRDVVTVIPDEIITKGKNIGYIIGAGDKVPQALEQLGYNIVLLNENNITAETLKPLDAVITGVRAYNVHDWLSAKYDVLMNYIKNGGNLIVQYNTNNNVGPVRAKIGPYPFNISRTRVTDENAPVTITNNPVFNYPNKITDKDFKGWIQERSIYHAEQLDDHYVAPITMNDPNESPSNGSLIIAKYGKGNFVYTGLVFFRELPAGVPGAFRLMANLIALPKNNVAGNESTK